MRDDLAADLLRWYDMHARAMPWRVPPADRAAGVVPDAYRVWLSEVMLQQTTVATVRDYFRRFVARWPKVGDLAAAADAEVMGEWAGLGYYARARNLLACARAVVADHGGVFPATRDGLLRLPGVGPYTAAAVASIAFDEPAAVVDGNVERVMARMFAVQAPLPGAKPALAALAAGLTPARRSGDYAQAVMDLGATICTPRRPACALCPWRDACAARADGVQDLLPRKAAKPPKPVRQGVVWLAHRGGDWLVETRGPRGLLGGMLGFPGDGWDGAGGPAPVVADWQCAGEVRHTFSHFHLVLSVQVGAAVGAPLRGQFTGHAFRPENLPTLMRKAFDLAQAAAAERGFHTPADPLGCAKRSSPVGYL